MSVSCRVIHHGLYFAVLGPLIGVLFLVLYISFAKEPLVLLGIQRYFHRFFIVDYYGSYSCIVNRCDGRLFAGKDWVR